MATDNMRAARVAALPEQLQQHIPDPTVVDRAFLSLMELEANGPVQAMYTGNWSMVPGFLQTDGVIRFVDSIIPARRPDGHDPKLGVDLRRERAAVVAGRGISVVHFVPMSCLDGLPRELQKEQLEAFIAANDREGNVRLVDAAAKEAVADDLDRLPDGWIVLETTENGPALYTEQNEFARDEDGVITSITGATQNFYPVRSPEAANASWMCQVLGNRALTAEASNEAFAAQLRALS